MKFPVRSFELKVDEARRQRHLWGEGGPELPPCLPQPGAPGASEQRPGRTDLSMPQAGAEAAPQGPAVRAEGSVLPPPLPAPKITQWEQPSSCPLRPANQSPDWVRGLEARLQSCLGGLGAQAWKPPCSPRGWVEPGGPLHSGQCSPPLRALELAGEPRRPPGIPEALG